jgi:hypothetical protein
MGWLCTIIVVTLVVLVGASSAPAQEIPPLFASGEETSSLGTNEFPRAVWMAVISDEKETRFLVQGGDPIFREGESHPVGIVRAVTPVDLTLALSRGNQEVRALPGRPIPDVHGLALRDVILVKALEYRHRLVDRGSRKTLGGELYLIDLEGTRAILRRDVDRPPSPTALMEQRLAAIQIVEVAPRVWEVNAEEIQNATGSGEAILKHILNESGLTISRTHGIGLEIKTPIADVRVTRRGFVITSPNLTRRAGLQVGDRILGVNGIPIDGYGDLVRVYRSIKNDSFVRTVDLTIDRHEQPLTLTFRVR